MTVIPFFFLATATLSQKTPVRFSHSQERLYHLSPHLVNGMSETSTRVHLPCVRLILNPSYAISEGSGQVRVRVCLSTSTRQKAGYENVIGHLGSSKRRHSPLPASQWGSGTTSRRAERLLLPSIGAQVPTNPLAVSRPSRLPVAGDS